VASYALCPFYEADDKSGLLCESGLLSFPGKSDRTLWLKMHCCSWNFKICKFYTELMRKYDDGKF